MKDKTGNFKERKENIVGKTGKKRKAGNKKERRAKDIQWERKWNVSGCGLMRDEERVHCIHNSC